MAEVEDTDGRGPCLLDSVASAQLSTGFTSPVECCGCDSAPSTWCSDACAGMNDPPHVRVEYVYCQPTGCLAEAKQKSSVK